MRNAAMDEPGVTPRWKDRVLRVQTLGRVSYESGLRIQEELVARRRSGEVEDQLLLLEHDHVITMGSSTEKRNIVADEGRLRELGVQVHGAGRGGDVTYHGPGQIVGYPILDLKPDRKDLHEYLRLLEGVLIRALHVYGLVGVREEGLTGVWVGDEKVAALGIRVSSGWITSHGFALNVSTDMRYFETIVPCGITDRGVTSLERLLGHTVDPEKLRRILSTAMVEEFGYGRVEFAA